MTAETSDRVLERLSRLHPKLIDLSLGRITRLLAALGNPHEKLPPVIHVAGTNGKGSTLATLRACLEAGGYRVHAYISPHLVRFHERIRLAGRLIEEEALIALLEECEAVNSGTPITYFEITTAAALLAFARIPADIVLLETGLGGRLDATNVISSPAVTAGWRSRLVASSRPPSPVSSSTMSAGTRAKARNAAAVVISKKVIGASWLARSHSSSSTRSASSSINCPASRMRSWNRTRCGEV